MKKIFLFICGAMIALSSFAQLPNGSIAPDWTMEDLDGVTHNMYTYLDSGYTVIIDFSAIWCAPCWNYHQSGALEDLYINHGPAGYPNVSPTTTDDVMVFFIEGDEGTIAQLNGGSGSQGNWVEGTPYPIIPTVAPNNNQVTSDYAIGYWPTIYMVCPNRIINENSQIGTAAHYALAEDCPPLSTTSNDANILGINAPSGMNCYSLIYPEIKLQNYGMENLTTVELISYIDDVEQSTFSWNGDIVQYGIEVVSLPEIQDIGSGDHEFKVVASYPNGVQDDDTTNNTLTESFIINTDGKEVILEILTDDYPMETSWELFFAGNVIASGNGYSGTQTIYDIPICLDNEQCYTFTVYDEYGDGMSYGGVTGHIVLTWDGVVMGEIPGDSFTFEASFDFCITTVGLDDPDNLEIEVYPNPSTGLVNIKGVNNAKVSVYKVTGALVAEYENFNEGIIDLSKQNSGIYIIKISNESFVITKRIAISR